MQQAISLMKEKQSADHRLLMEMRRNLLETQEVVVRSHDELLAVRASGQDAFQTQQNFSNSPTPGASSQPMAQQLFEHALLYAPQETALVSW